LEQVCLAVGKDDNPDTKEVEWAYRGGCFKNGETAIYTQAEPNSVYNFERIQIVVREQEEK